MARKKIPQASSATQPAKASRGETDTEIAAAKSIPTTRGGLPPQTELPGHADDDPQRCHAGQCSLGGQRSYDTQEANAAQNPSGSAGADDGRPLPAIHLSGAVIGELLVQYRYYTQLRRARQRLELQAQAVCRALCNGDKEAGRKLYRKPDAQAFKMIAPFEAAMEPLDQNIDYEEKQLSKLGKRLPVADWTAEIAGLSPRFFAMIVAECGIGPGEYRSVSALWKRMGLAVIGGERQRRVTGDAAIEHGYVATRRSLVWNVGESLIKAQIRNPKGDDGKPIGEPVAIGPYGQVYLDRKAYLVAKNEAGGFATRKEARDGKLCPSHLHADAKRYMEKRLLRELWKAWRRSLGPADNHAGNAPPPNFSDPSGAAALRPSSIHLVPRPMDKAA